MFVNYFLYLGIWWGCVCLCLNLCVQRYINWFNANSNFLFEFVSRLQFVNSLVVAVKTNPKRSFFTGLRYKKLGLLISAREVSLPSSLRLTDAIKQRRNTSINTLVIQYHAWVKGIHIVQLSNRLTVQNK